MLCLGVATCIASHRRTLTPFLCRNTRGYMRKPESWHGPCYFSKPCLLNGFLHFSPTVALPVSQLRVWHFLLVDVRPYQSDLSELHFSDLDKNYFATNFNVGLLILCQSQSPQPVSNLPMIFWRCRSVWQSANETVEDLSTKFSALVEELQEHGFTR